jgi:large subunit ribosomal protein L21
MFAVVQFGEKQYKAVVGEAIEIERLDAGIDEKVEIKDILLVVKDNETIIDNNELKKYTVHGKILKEYRDDKVIVFKKKRRKGYVRKRGHRQYKTILLVEDITSSK